MLSSLPDSIELHRHPVQLHPTLPLHQLSVCRRSEGGGWGWAPLQLPECHVDSNHLEEKPSGRTGGCAHLPLPLRSLPPRQGWEHEAWGFIPSSQALRRSPAYRCGGGRVGEGCGLLRGEGESGGCHSLRKATITRAIRLSSTAMMGIPTFLKVSRDLRGLRKPAISARTMERREESESGLGAQPCQGS